PNPNESTRSARNTSTTSTSRNISTSLPSTPPSPASTPPSTPTSTPLSRSLSKVLFSGASAVAINAEIRRTKARLLKEVLNWRLAIKKVKGLWTEELAACNDLVLGLPNRIQTIPDGTAAAPKQSGGWTVSASCTEIKFDSDGQFNSEYFQQTEESSQFGQGYKMWKMKQACNSLEIKLEVISEGLDTLKNMAHDLNEEMDRQVPLMDEIDTKVDKVASDLKNTNVRLKDTVILVIELPLYFL
ncbi:Syntaxin-71, partial [Camellia lanceoleosa]